MQPNNFCIMLESINAADVSIRFYSQGKADIRIRDVKYYYSPKNCVKPIEQFYNTKLDNDYKTLAFHIANEENKMITSINFIVKDVVAKEQYAVQVKLDTTQIIYKKMIYEG